MGFREGFRDAPYATGTVDVPYVQDCAEIVFVELFWRESHNRRLTFFDMGLALLEEFTVIRRTKSPGSSTRGPRPTSSLPSLCNFVFAGVMTPSGTHEYLDQSFGRAVGTLVPPHFSPCFAPHDQKHAGINGAPLEWLHCDR